MAITHVTTARDHLADNVNVQINVGTFDTGGDLVLKQGDTTIVMIEFQDPAFGDSSSGTITLLGVPLSGTANNGGTADIFMIRNRDNSNIVSGFVTQTSDGGDIELDNNVITSSQTVQITSLTYSSSA